MKIFSLRSLFYFCALLVAIAAIEFKKVSIKAENKKSVVSVLGLLLKDGAPVEVKSIEPTAIEDTLKATLFRGGNNMAYFYKSRAIASRLRPGMKALDSHNRSPIGQVKQVSSQADYRNGLYKTLISMNSSDEAFKNENVLVAEVLLKQKSNVFVVPLEIVERELNKQYLWIAEDGKAKRREIETGIQNDREIEVTKGLSQGEQIIVKGLAQAREYNDQINIVKSVSQSSEPKSAERQ